MPTAERSNRLPITWWQCDAENNAIGSVSNSRGLTSVVPGGNGANKAGNLVIAVVYTQVQPTGAWTNTLDSAQGWNAIGTASGVQYDSTNFGRIGIYWKINAGNLGALSSTTFPGSSTHASLVCEFFTPGGWNPSAFDVGADASSVGTTSLVSGSVTPTTDHGLAIALLGANASITNPAFTNGFLLQRPTMNVNFQTPNPLFSFAWREYTSTAAFTTTASWTTSSNTGLRVATFKALPAFDPDATLLRTGERKA